MTRLKILRLRADNVMWMRKLNALFANAFEDDEQYSGSPPPDEYLARQLAKTGIYALVAVADETVVGGLVGYELPKLEQARSEIYIYDLAVAEEHRRHGIATALIAELQSIAKEQDAWVIYVQADYGDEPAIALYTKLGIREDVMHFDIAPAAD